jgi:hypothetical protein
MHQLDAVATIVRTLVHRRQTVSCIHSASSGLQAYPHLLGVIVCWVVWHLELCLPVQLRGGLVSSHVHTVDGPRLSEAWGAAEKKKSLLLLPWFLLFSNCSWHCLVHSPIAGGCGVPQSDRL